MKETVTKEQALKMLEESKGTIYVVTETMMDTEKNNFVLPLVSGIFRERDNAKKCLAKCVENFKRLNNNIEPTFKSETWVTFKIEDGSTWDYKIHATFFDDIRYAFDISFTNSGTDIADKK